MGILRRVLLVQLAAAVAAAPLAAQSSYGTIGSASTSSGTKSSSFSSSSGTGMTVAPVPSAPSGGGVQSPSFSSGNSGKTIEAAFPARASQKAADFFGAAGAPSAGKPGEPARPAAAGATVLRSAEMQRRRLRTILDELLGTPYRAGGREPGEGLDSAGLIWHAFRSIQRTVTDDVEDQQRLGTRFTADQFVERGKLRDDARLATGDILYFRVGQPQQGLTGYRPVIYYGDGLGVYPSQSKGRVVLEDIRDRARALAFVQRVLQ